MKICSYYGSSIIEIVYLLDNTARFFNFIFVGFSSLLIYTNLILS